MRNEAGFSLLELLIASSMTILVVGGMLLILDGVSDLHRDQQELIDAQQTARLGLDQMQRDVQLAGIGVTGMLAPLPVVVPTAGGGLDVRYNLGNVTARLSADMASGSSPLTVDDVTNFETGMIVAIYDGTGSFDLVTLTSVDIGASQLMHDGASKAYQVSDGTAIKRVQTISYTLQTVNDNFWLQRQEDDGDPQPVAINVRSMTITYYNDANPPQPFVPVTLADQMGIKVIEIELEVETQNVRLNTTEERTVTLTTRVTPRAVLLSS